jgi:hypothetical protein
MNFRDLKCHFSKWAAFALLYRNGQFGRWNQFKDPPGFANYSQTVECHGSQGFARHSALRTAQSSLVRIHRHATTRQSRAACLRYDNTRSNIVTHYLLLSNFIFYDSSSSSINVLVQRGVFFVMNHHRSGSIAAERCPTPKHKMGHRNCPLHWPRDQIVAKLFCCRSFKGFIINFYRDIIFLIILLFNRDRQLIKRPICKYCCSFSYWFFSPCWRRVATRFGPPILASNIGTLA